MYDVYFIFWFSSGFSTTTSISSTVTSPHEECYVANGTNTIVLSVSLLINLIEILFVNYLATTSYY